MDWWIKEEIEKFKNKKVQFNNAIWTVKEVFWKESDEEFVYWIENTKGRLEKVYEKNIKLLNDEKKV